MALWGEVITPSRPCTFNCERGKLDFVAAVLLSSSPVSVKIQISDGPSWTLHRFDPSVPNQRFRLLFEEDVTFTCHPLPSSSSSSVEVQLLGNIVAHPRPLMDLSGSEDEEVIEGEEDEEEEEEEEMVMTADEEVSAAKKKEKTAAELPKIIEALGDQIIRKVNEAAVKRSSGDKIEENESQPMKRTKINKNNEKTKMMTATTAEASRTNEVSKKESKCNDHDHHVVPKKKNQKIEKSNQSDMEIKKNMKSNNISKLPNKQCAPSKQNITSSSSVSSASAASLSSVSAASLSSKTTTSSSSSSTEVRKVGLRFEVRGVKCEILEVGGSGRKTESGVQTGQKVTVRYLGTLAKNGKRFDSGTMEFRVGAGSVIPGFEFGVKGMQIKEKRRVLIPSRLAYGEEGSPPVIPGNADLVFELTLLGMK